MFNDTELWIRTKQLKSAILDSHASEFLNRECSYNTNLWIDLRLFNVRNKTFDLDKIELQMATTTYWQNDT